MKTRALFALLATTTVFTAVSCQNNGSDEKPMPQAVVIRVDESNSGGPVDLTKFSPSDRSKFECIQSLCGMEYPFKNTYESNPALIEKNKKMVQESIGRDVELLMGRIIKIELKLKDTLVAISKTDPASLPLTTFQKGLITAQKFLTYDLDDALDYIEDKDGNGRMIFKVDELKKINPLWTGDEIDAMQGLASVYYSISHDSRLDILDVKSTLDELTKNAYKMENGVWVKFERTELEALKELAEASLITMEQLKKYYIPELMNSYNKYLFMKAVSMQSLTDREKIDFFTIHRKYSVQFSLANQTEAIEKIGRLPFNLDQVIQDTLQNYNREIGKITHKKTLLKDAFKSAENICLETLAQSLSNTPTAEENLKAKSVLEAIQIEADKIINLKMKQTNVEKFQFDFILPLNQTESLSYWSDFIRATKLALDEVPGKIDEINGSSQMTPQLLTSIYMRYAKKNDFFNAAINTCKRSEPAFLNDAAYGDINIFRASWVTVKYLDQGAGIIAHEVSHLISHKYPELFKPEVACLKSKQNSEDYIEEDFADLLSSKILNGLNANGSFKTSKNMSCGLGNVNKQTPDEITTTNSNLSDPHSSQLYRILSVSAARGQSSQQCEAYLDKYEPKALIFRNYCDVTYE